MDGVTLPINSRDEFERYCRAQVSAVYVGDRTLLCRVMGKYLCYVDSDDGAVAAHLAMDGFWETWNSLAIARHVGRGWRVVDVGANHGYFTLLLAELVGPEGRVFAIEPNPRLFDLLQRTVRLNGFDDRVTLLPYAAGEIEADAELRVPRGFSGDGSVRRVSISDDAPAPVRQRRIDAMVDGPIDFLKIDAEGADYAALAGASGVLPRDRAVDVMLEHYAPFHDCPRERLAQVMAGGFSCRRVGYDGKLAGATLDDLEGQPSRLWDLWLSRRPEE
jgi:FkbM family methyltransferase